MEVKSTEKENKPISIRDSIRADQFFQTTYEKVLSIINQVKDFIKKSSNPSQKLINDLEWVVEVITNKSLYSYEVNKDRITKKNSEYNKFINFVTQYNEEILESNKKHILLSSIFNIGKKAEILLKPSLVLKKILPSQLKSLEYQKEREKKARKKTSINVIGNCILNLYYKGLEKIKKEKEEKEKLQKKEENIENKEEKVEKDAEKIEKEEVGVEKNKNDKIDKKEIQDNNANNNDNKINEQKKEENTIIPDNIENNIEKESIINTDQNTNNETINQTKDIPNQSDIKTDNIEIENKEIEPKEKRVPILSLIEQYFDDIETITNEDFNIFEFKKKVGYKNVLPIMCHVIMKTLGLIDPKIIPKKKLDSFLYTVSDNYKETTLYHNSLHGADVTQSLCIYFLNSNAEEISEITVLDLLGMIVSAMGHDLGHPGYNNNYHINARTELSITYNDVSCLENYHTSYLFRILQKEENNILEKLNTQNYKSIRKRMISQILSTDMANHGEVISLIKAKIKTCEDEGLDTFTLLSGNEKTKFDEQQILLNYMIHAADLGHNCKKFKISLQWVEVLCEEFWRQGDMEKKKGIPVSFLCDRDKIDVPSSQVGFLKGFVVTTFDCLIKMFPSLIYTMDNAKNNIKEWKKLSEKHRLRGWTPEKEKDKDKDSN